MVQSCRSFFLGSMLLFTLHAAAQAPSFNGWFFSSHEQQLSRKWSLLSDIQFRSAAKLSYFRTILLRPAIQLQVSEKSSVALGYAHLINFEKKEGKISADREHRIWQQYILKLESGNSEITNRLRTEQRFLENPDGGYNFAQRVRHYIRLMKPINAGKEFTAGFFVAIQNEIFLNTDNKENVNGRIFDQDRFYVGPGYRFSKAIEVEAGYMFRYQLEETGRLRDHILQVTVTTSL